LVVTPAVVPAVRRQRQRRRCNATVPDHPGWGESTLATTTGGAFTKRHGGSAVQTRSASNITDSSNSASSNGAARRRQRERRRRQLGNCGRSLVERQRWCGGNGRNVNAGGGKRPRWPDPQGGREATARRNTTVALHSSGTWFSAPPGSASTSLSSNSASSNGASRQSRQRELRRCHGRTRLSLG